MTHSSVGSPPPLASPNASTMNSCSNSPVSRHTTVKSCSSTATWIPVLNSPNISPAGSDATPSPTIASHTTTPTASSSSASIQQCTLPGVATSDSMLDKYYRATERSLIFTIRLRTLSATDSDAQLWPAYTDPGTLALHSTLFGSLLDRCEQGSCFRDADGLHSGLILGLDLPQQLLHEVLRSLYAGSISLGPHNVEACLMIAQYLGLAPVQHACCNYITDHLLQPALDDKQAGPAAQQQLLLVLQLAYSYCPQLRQQVCSALGDVWGYSATLTSLLDSAAVSCEQAAELLLQVKEANCLCETQVLDCLSRMPAKRSALLPLLADFPAMHDMELAAVAAYSGAWQQQDGDGQQQQQPPLTTEAKSFWQGVQQAVKEAQELPAAERRVPPGLHVADLPVYKAESVLSSDHCHYLLTSFSIEEEGPKDFSLAFDRSMNTAKGPRYLGALSLYPGAGNTVRTATRHITVDLLTFAHSPGEPASSNGSVGTDGSSDDGGVAGSSEAEAGGAGSTGNGSSSQSGGEAARPAGMVDWLGNNGAVPFEGIEPGIGWKVAKASSWWLEQPQLRHKQKGGYHEYVTTGVLARWKEL